MRQLFFGLLSGLLLLTSCSEESLLENNPAPPSDNLFWSLVPYYGDEGLKYDSIYTNQLGIDFIIDSVSLLITDVSFYDDNLKETIDTAANLILLQRGSSEKLNGYLPAGGYYGKYRVIIGSDSANSAKLLQDMLKVAPAMVRKDDYGFNFFRIKGRIFDPSEPKEDTVLIPIEYTLGSYLLTDTMYTDQRSFSVDNNQQITIVLLSDLKPILNNINFNLLQEIISDPSDLQDFTAAQLLRDSLSIGIF